MGELVLEEGVCVKSGRGAAAEIRSLRPPSYCSEMVIAA